MLDSVASSASEALLQNRIDLLEHQLEELLLNERRNQIVMGFTDITIFEYEISSGTITTNQNDRTEFDMPEVITNGVEDIIASGIITERSVAAFRELYHKIDSGEPTASATVVALDNKNEERFLEIDLVTIFDKYGKPLRAIGVRKDITEKMLLQQEKQYGDSLASMRNLSFEANITTDSVIHYNKTWAAQLGFTDVGRFSEMTAHIFRGNAIHPDHVDMLRSRLDRESIMDAFHNGRRLLSFEYLKTLDGYNYEWQEQTVNIIKDRLLGDIIIRSYIVNIHERKSKELHAIEEQRRFEMMRAKAATVYELNVTKNIFISGHEKLVQHSGMSPDNNYTHILKAFSAKVIHKDDQHEFLETFSRENILEQYEGGKTEFAYEYRTLNATESFIWVRCTMHVFEGSYTNDLRGFAYLENINTDKLRELELLYKAQHDMLTGFYDKASAKEQIDSFITSPEGISSKHAFFIVDIDHFKSINDHFGHAFGDTVLARTAQKLGTLFRKSDLLCRIGGDEFVVLMKNIRSYKTALLKAKEMCDSVLDAYTYGGDEYNLSISVGIAYYDRHGRNYDELYAHSDIALYYAKEHGRNRFALYHSSIRGNITSIKEQKPNLLFQSNNFTTTMHENIFRALYEATNKDAAIRSALAIVGQHYNVSRAYVFENSSDGKFTSNTYEWCNDGVPSQIEILQSIPFSDLGTYTANFNDEGVFYLPDITQTSGITRSILESQNIKSLVQISIVRDGQFVGFIGFDQCDVLHVPSLRELWDYRNTANILGIFIMEMRALAESSALRDMALSIVNGLDSYAYVCDPDTHRLLFVNEETLRLVPDVKIGDYCYRSFWGLAHPCTQCPMRELEKDSKKKYSSDIYNFNLDLWVKSTASWIDWLDEKRVCLIDSVDITKYKLDWTS